MTEQAQQTEEQTQPQGGINPDSATVVPWRETHREVIAITNDESSQGEHDAHYTIRRDELDEAWNDLLERINLEQGEIKSVTVFSESKGYGETRVAQNALGGGNLADGWSWGVGWGVEIPDFVEIIYEITDYILFSEYQKRKDQARKALQKRKIDSDIDKRQKSREKLAAELSEIDDEYRPVAQQLKNLKGEEPVEDMGVFKRGWKFNGQTFSSQPEAATAKEKAVKEKQSELDDIADRKNAKEQEVQQMDSIIESLRRKSAEFDV